MSSASTSASAASSASKLRPQYDGLRRVEAALSALGGGADAAAAATAATVSGNVRDVVDVAHDVYLKTKQEVRLLLEFKQSLGQDKLKKMMGDHFNPDKKYSAEASDISQFDAEYGLNFTNQVEPAKQELIRKLIDYKDRLFFDLMSHVLDELGVESMNEYIAPKVSSNLPEYKVWSTFFTVLQTFRSLAKFKKRAEVSKNESELQKEVAIKALEIKDIQESLAKKSNQVRDLQHQLQQILVESGRNLLMSRQQDTITQLELAATQFNKQLRELLDSNRNLLLENGILKDEMIAQNSQLESLKALYKENVETLRPAIEGDIYKSSLEQREITALRNEIDLYKSNIKKLVLHSTATQKENDTRANKIYDMERNIKLQEAMLMRSQAEAKRQSNLKMVAIASKLKFEKLYKEAESLTKKTIEEKIVVEEAKIVVEEELVEMEQYIETLQEFVEKAEDRSKQSEARYHMANAEKSAFEASYKNLEDEIKNACTMDQKEALEATIKQQQEQILRIQSQVRAANKRIYDLEDELSRK